MNSVTLAWSLNAFGLFTSMVAAVIMFYYPPRMKIFTEKGAEVVSFVRNPDPQNAARGKRQSFLGRFGPFLLIVGFAFQLGAAFLSR